MIGHACMTRLAYFNWFVPVDKVLITSLSLREIAPTKRIPENYSYVNVDYGERVTFSVGKSESTNFGAILHTSTRIQCQLERSMIELLKSNSIERSCESDIVNQNLHICTVLYRKAKQKKYVCFWLPTVPKFRSPTLIFLISVFGFLQLILLAEKCFQF